MTSYWIVSGYSLQRIARQGDMPERQTYPGALLDPVSRGFSKTEDTA